MHVCIAKQKPPTDVWLTIWAIGGDGSGRVEKWGSQSTNDSTHSAENVSANFQSGSEKTRRPGSNGKPEGNEDWMQDSYIRIKVAMATRKKDARVNVRQRVQCWCVRVCFKEQTENGKWALVRSSVCVCVCKEMQHDTER